MRLIKIQVKCGNAWKTIRTINNLNTNIKDVIYWVKGSFFCCDVRITDNLTGTHTIIPRWEATT